jgi:hypothetical protein
MPLYVFLFCIIIYHKQGRIPRHAAIINEIIRRAFASVHVPAAIEPSGTFRGRYLL